MIDQQYFNQFAGKADQNPTADKVLFLWRLINCHLLLFPTGLNRHVVNLTLFEQCFAQCLNLQRFDLDLAIDDSVPNFDTLASRIETPFGTVKDS